MSPAELEKWLHGTRWVGPLGEIQFHPNQLLTGSGLKSDARWEPLSKNKLRVTWSKEDDQEYRFDYTWSSFKDPEDGKDSYRIAFMPLHPIPLDLSDAPPSREIGDWIDEAARRREDFYDEGLGLRIPKYVPSNPQMVHAAINDLKENGHLRGDAFCEWGSGFAVATGIAALLGMEAYGLEIEPELIDRSRQLAADMGVPITILDSDYLPEGFDESEEMGGKELILPEATMAGEIMPEYDGLDPADVDLFFVYPYPDQEEMMMDLFDAVATHGAVLLLYREEGEVDAFIQSEEDEAY